MQKRILLSSNTAWSIYNFRHGLITTLLANDFKVITLSPKDDCSSRLEEMGCTVIDVPMSAKGINPIADLALVLKLKKIYLEVNADFIITYTIKPNIYGSIAAWLSRKPSIAVTTGLGYTFLNKNITSKVAHLLYKFAFLFPKEVWFLNKDDLSTFTTYKLIDSRKSNILHGEGVNTTIFSPSSWNKEDGKFRFILIARMLWDKGIGEFIQAARKLRKAYPNAVFQLLGACDVLNPSVIERKQIADWEQEGIIEYLGVTTDVRPFVAQANCVVLPSYREGIPRTLMEAAAMAKPLIATDVPGCRDVIIHGKTGLLCPARDAEALSFSMATMMSMSAAEHRIMGQAGRAFMINNFDEQLIIAQYIATLARHLDQLKH